MYSDWKRLNLAGYCAGVNRLVRCCPALRKTFSESFGPRR